MTTLKFLLFSLILTSVLACHKNEIEQVNELSSSNKIVSTFDVNNFEAEDCISEDDFWAISEALVGYMVQLRDSSRRTFPQKSESYLLARSAYPESCPLCTIMNLHKNHFRIDSVNVQKFFDMLIAHKTTILKEDFAECYYNMLLKKLENSEYEQINNQDSRWFLGTLAGALGAGPCVSGPLSILDACAGIATGILTSPTGIGAVACWGSAAASYGYGMSSIGDCFDGGR